MGAPLSIPVHEQLSVNQRTPKTRASGESEESGQPLAPGQAPEEAARQPPISRTEAAQEEAEAAKAKKEPEGDSFNGGGIILAAIAAAVGVSLLL